MLKITLLDKVLKAVNEKCCECPDSDTPESVKKCEFPECCLYPYRTPSIAKKEGT